jgi:hypothetical protein
MLKSIGVQGIVTGEMSLGLALRWRRTTCSCPASLSYSAECGNSLWVCNFQKRIRHTADSCLSSVDLRPSALSWLPIAVLAKNGPFLASIDIEYGAGCGAASARRSLSSHVYKNSGWTYQVHSHEKDYISTPPFRDLFLSSDLVVTGFFVYLYIYIYISVLTTFLAF